MMWFYILGTLCIVFFLLKNIHSTGEYKKYSEKAVFVFDDTRKAHKVSRIFFAVCFVIACVLLVVSLLVLHVQDPGSIMGLICLTIGSFLFAFFPFTPGRWVLTDQGIYLYNYNAFIPWTQMIGTQITARGKKTYLILTLKQTEKESLKKTMYPLLIPADQAVKISNMIGDFIKMIEKKRYRKHLNEERSVALKDRKFY